ncbi:MAG: ATP-binding protein, partial [Bacteroidetes bacterium]|nr:ATP-binding protein [Bacteroidota bacterium]
DSVNFFRNTAEKKNLFLTTETNYESLQVNLNQGILRQVMYNLINNAIKFTNNGGIIVNIEKETVKENNYAAIRVKDTGIGIPENKQDLIWEEYRQVSEGLNRSFEGTGLGLTITKNFVSKLGGEIVLEESEVQKGSTFKILFPINGGAETISDIIKPEIKKEPARVENLNPEAVLPQILYVEDDPKAVRLVEIFLKCLCRIDAAQDSDECLRKLKENKYDAIIMDINLGKGLDGIQTAGLIRKIPGCEKIPIVANTAYAMGGDKEEFLQKGCPHYISKPFKASELRELMINVLAGK